MSCKIVIRATAGEGLEIAAAVSGLAGADVVLQGADEAGAVDLRESAVGIAVASDWSAAAGADVVVLAGADAQEVGPHVAERCPDAVVVVAGAPVEQTCRDLLTTTRFPRARVIGVAGIVEAVRLRAEVAHALGVSAHDVSALVLGGRGASAVPVLSALRLGGMRVTDKLAADQVAGLVTGIHDGPPAGPRLVAACVADVVEAILHDRRRVLACATLCTGELGLQSAVAGVPVVVGAAGVERILDVVLDDGEREALAASAVPFPR